MRILRLNLFIFFLLAFREGSYPIPLEKQLSSSYGVLDAIYQETSFKKSSGEIVSVASFKILKSVGLKYREKINKNNFNLILPGGRWQGLNYHSKNVPQFKKNERVILLISKTKKGFFLNNLSLGKYNIYLENGHEYLRSATFPNHPSLGRIKMTLFEQKVMDAFGEKLEKIHHKKFVYNQNIKKKDHSSTRRPSSLDKTNNENNNGLLWPIILLGLLGLFPPLFFKKQ